MKGDLILRAALGLAVILLGVILVVALTGCDAGSADYNAPTPVRVTLENGKTIQCIQALRNGGLSCDWGR